jgi:hygromycin-B 7''-O-kinase
VLGGGGVFAPDGHGRFLGRTLAAYGYRRDQLGPDLRRRLLAWGILHRYSNLRRWMSRLPEPARPTLDALADRWFATE